MLRLLLIFLLINLSALAQEAWRIEQGVTSIQFNREILKDLGFQVEAVRTTGTPYRKDYLGFTFSPQPGMGFETANGDFEYLHSGTFIHQGGFVLTHGNLRFSLEEFRLEVLPGSNDLLLLAQDGFPVFRLLFSHTYLREKQLLLINTDLVATRELGEAIGMRGLEYTLMGTVDQVMRVSGPPELTLAGGCIPNFEGDVDVTLTSISGPTQIARVAGDRVALAASAALANIGTADVPWYRSISPDGGIAPGGEGQHPFLVLHFYRLHNGVLEQLGRSDVKHAFFAVNSGCPCAGGQVLFVGCGDVYGASTNASRFYLAPREEVAAFTGSWTSLGSHFDGEPVDNIRDHGDSGHDSFEHRLTVADADLAVAGARYFFELWYVVQNDINIFNSMGWLEVVPSLPASTWLFSIPNPGTNSGPTIDAWVSPLEPTSLQKSSTLAAEEGTLRLAVSVTGTSSWSYEYALMNLDMDRQIRSFSLPIEENVSISNAGFGRPGISGPDDWTITVQSDRILWEAPPGKGLDWGALANFRFQANAAPSEMNATLLPLEGEGPSQYLVATRAPSACVSQAQIGEMFPLWNSSITILEIIPLINNSCSP